MCSCNQTTAIARLQNRPLLSAILARRTGALCPTSTTPAGGYRHVQ
jgi:hypothetical protein